MFNPYYKLMHACKKMFKNVYMYILHIQSILKSGLQVLKGISALPYRFTVTNYVSSIIIVTPLKLPLRKNKVNCDR
jgi:hypothetical protein